MGVIVGSVLAAQAGQIRYVSKTGENIAPYTSWRRAARTIHAAVRVSAAGDTIVVGPGVYAITSTIVPQKRNRRSRRPVTVLASPVFMH